MAEDQIGKRTLTIPELGNEITCLPCNYRTVQGIAVPSLLMVDELHAVADIRAYNYLRAQTEMRGSQVAISTQAGSPELDNPVWRLWLARDEPHILFDYSEEHRTAWGIKLAQQQRAELTPAEFDALHRNLWAGLGQKLFEAQALGAAAMEYAECYSHADLQERIREWGFGGWDCVIGAGLDRAGVSATGDRSVLTATAKFSPREQAGRGKGFDTENTETQRGTRNGGLGGGNGGAGVEQYRVIRVWVFETGEEAEILAAFRELAAICGPLGCETRMEYFNCVDLVGKVRRAELASPSSPHQRQLFNGLYRLFNERRIGYPQDCGFDPRKRQPGLLKSELLNFEYGRSAGIWKWGTQSGHDDTVYSLAWSCEAAPEAARVTATIADYVMGSGSYVAQYA